jgi:hypothetical protein
VGAKTAGLSLTLCCRCIGCVVTLVCGGDPNEGLDKDKQKRVRTEDLRRLFERVKERYRRRGGRGWYKYPWEYTARSSWIITFFTLFKGQ